METELEKLTEELTQMQEEVKSIAEGKYSGLKTKFECRRCGKKNPSNFPLLISLHFVPLQDGLLCPDCLRKYIYEIEKSTRKE